MIMVAAGTECRKRNFVSGIAVYRRCVGHTVFFGQILIQATKYLAAAFRHTAFNPSYSDLRRNFRCAATSQKPTEKRG